MSDLSTVSKRVNTLLTIIPWTFAALQWTALISFLFTLRLSYYRWSADFLVLSMVFFMFIFAFYFINMHLQKHYLIKQRRILDELRLIYAKIRRDNRIINKIYFWKQSRRIIKD